MPKGVYTRGLEDLTGKRFGKLTVLSLAGKTRGGAGSAWECKCDCGEVTFAIGSRMVNGSKRSCGCNKGNWSKNGRAICYIDGHHSWTSMIRRCRPDYFKREDYFDRGISVCKEWMPGNRGEGFRRFISHIGPRPSCGYSVDRIDNDKGYIPGNVRWATGSEQIKNQRKRARIDQFTTDELIAEINKRNSI